MTGVATRIAYVVEPVLGEMPVHLRAWDGSEAGPDVTATVALNSPRALRRLLWHPGELGAAQAFVTGEADIEGDLDATLQVILDRARVRSITKAEGARVLIRLLAAARELGLVGALPRAPSSQARMGGRLHSRARDRRAIHHHYDLSNAFYELILDPSMAYSCAYFSEPGMTVAQAQQAKLDLICTKLGLRNGSTLLDVGCGWGSLSIHAAKNFGARVTAITLAEEQRRFVATHVEGLGLGDVVDVRICDYRDTTGTFDAVASIEMGEHVGKDNYPSFASTLVARTRPGGRTLVQQMSRSGKHPGGGPFIESFIAPDMHMRPVGETVDLLETAGFEVRDVQAMREHYVATVEGWLERFEANRKALTDLVGPEVMRVWHLYLVGGAAAFREGRMGVDQILAVRPGGPHEVDLRRSW